MSQSIRHPQLLKSMRTTCYGKLNRQINRLHTDSIRNKGKTPKKQKKKNYSKCANSLVVIWFYKAELVVVFHPLPDQTTFVKVFGISKRNCIVFSGEVNTFCTMYILCLLIFLFFLLGFFFSGGIDIFLNIQERQCLRVCWVYHIHRHLHVDSY